MIKKVFTTLFIMIFICSGLFAKDIEKTDSGAEVKTFSYQRQLNNINKLHKSVKKDKANEKAIREIIRLYTNMGNYYMQEKEYGTAAIYYRSAMFYVFVYSVETQNFDFQNEYIPVNKSYKNCLKKMKIKESPQMHFQTAQLLQSIGEYPAAGFEYSKAYNSKKYKDKSLYHLKQINQILGFTKEKPSEKMIQKANSDIDFSDYLKKVQKKIKANWNPPKYKQSTHVTVLFSINKPGELVRCEILKSSGDKNVDDAAISAVKKSEPFDALPHGFTGDNIDINFTFDYNVYKEKQKI